MPPRDSVISYSVRNHASASTSGCCGLRSVPSERLTSSLLAVLDKEPSAVERSLVPEVPSSSLPNQVEKENANAGAGAKTLRKLQLRTRASSGSVATPPILRVALTLLFASTTTVIQPRRIKSCPTANPLPQATTRTLATSLRPGVS
ncbi:hypothetical protein PF006_g25629 [Phytophthora fragariae]|uniref:Uncharacterized protein n=1 Tax=Phytophthora fragariae TaxID=53985 RepID=A0A6A3DRQ7_9STRA|nr:hypothetical protein PF009_g26954 [Phytophthora fragariae]KAE8973616.1 hypothetical protein PF011_g25177 [Phytophthora fragariae]KAE9088252.1 hypothetical protein PF006_g25629 [Phytophthora fragariae]KAE9179220.1 hypothetical protein PF004_g25232 [Phytophthora fragariae]